MASDAAPDPVGLDPAQVSLADSRVLFNPTAYYRALREKDPVHYDQTLGMYVVSRHAELAEVLRNWEVFSLELGYHRMWGQGHLDELKQILDREGGGYIPDFIMSDPPNHNRLRRLLEGAFTPRRLKLLEPQVRAFVAGLVDDLADRGRADGVADLAAPMTMNFMCSQLALTNVDPAKIHAWANAYMAQFSGLQSREEMLANAAQICELQRYIIELVREREANPGEDMISDLVTARIDGEGNPTLKFEEVVALARALLIGGLDSITTALSSLLLMAATDTEVAGQLYACADDDLQLARFVEESLRLHTPVRALSRVATREVELGGTRIPAGAQILAVFASGNDDETVFPDARRFDLDRDNLGQHLAFGSGIHRCVGQALARMQVKTAAREIARKLEDIRLTVPVEEIGYAPSIAMLAMKSLPLAFRRRTTGA